MIMMMLCILQPLVGLLSQDIEGFDRDPFVPWVLWSEGIFGLHIYVVKGRGQHQAVGVEEHAVWPHVPSIRIREIPNNGVPQVG